MPSSAMLCILGTLSAMTFYLRTAHGVSTTSYGGSRTNPFQGLCQGNGGAPGGWLCLCCVLVAYLQQEGHVIELTPPFTSVLLVLAALIFVDDTDLLTMDKYGDPTITRVVHDMQHGVDTWEGGLIVSGGALKPSKCKAQMVGFRFING